MITLLRWLAAAAFVAAGAMHFVRPELYESIVPPQLPAHGVLVAISGMAEVLGGIGLLFRRTRRVAGLGLILLLVAVFPANLYMAIDPGEAGHGAPQWALWARLPLQVVIGAVVYLVSLRRV